MTTKLNFVWSKTSQDHHHGVIHIHDREGELRYRAYPAGEIDVRPGKYRFRVQIAGRETAVSDIIDVSGESTTVDLDEAPLPIQSLPTRSYSMDVGLVPFTKQWRVETWTGNMLRGSLKKVASLGRWDGRFSVGLPAAREATLFVRVAAVDESAQLLVAVPGSNENAASLAAIDIFAPSVTDDRACMRVESSNPAVRMLLDWLSSGAMSDAVQLAPQLAAGLIEPAQKKKDPIGAAMACSFLLNVVDYENDPHQMWPRVSKAARMLKQYESWLPDGVVLAASVAAVEGDYAGAAESLRHLDTLGPPIITSSLVRAIDLIQLITSHVPEPAYRVALRAIRSRLVKIAISADLSQQFLTLRDFDPELAPTDQDHGSLENSACA